MLFQCQMTFLAAGNKDGEVCIWNLDEGWLEFRALEKFGELKDWRSLPTSDFLRHRRLYDAVLLDVDAGATVCN